MAPDSSTQPVSKPISRAADAMPARTDPFARRVITAWRRLTGGRAARDAGRPTLVACSGGADSSALAAALAGVNTNIVIAHIRHDLRPTADTQADESAARDLATRLDRPFASRTVQISEEPGNAESNARRARYRALAQIAEHHQLAFVATAHHADDQLETILMRLLRGAGPRGMAGIRPTRRLGAHTRLVRPMLETTHQAATEFLARHRIPWAEDRTNQDLSRLRAALRHTVAPALRDVNPRAAIVAARSARSFADAADALASAVVPPADADKRAARWFREDLARASRAVAAETLLAQLRTQAPRTASPNQRQTPTSAELEAVLEAIQTAGPHRWAGKLAAARVTITSKDVVLDYPY